MSYEADGKYTVRLFDRGRLVSTETFDNIREAAETAQDWRNMGEGAVAEVDAGFDAEEGEEDADSAVHPLHRCRRGVTDVFHLHEAAKAAEAAFVSAYTADPNRKGMRPGDFRYHSDLHSPATRAAAAAFQSAMDEWRREYRMAVGVPKP